MRMLHIHQYETPEFALKANSADALRGYSRACISFAQRNGQPIVVLDGSDVDVDEDAGTVAFSLTQLQSGRLPLGEVLIQVNVYYADTSRYACCEIPIEVRRNQIREVMR